MKLKVLGAMLLAILCAPTVSSAVEVGAGPALARPRITQADIASGELSRDEIRLAGRRLFSTPFNKQDGMGDGDDVAVSPAFGNRTTLQDNGSFLRVNGLDAQTCLECHSVLSRATVPMKFGVGGVGGINNSPVGAGGATYVDAIDALQSGGDPKRNIDGRVANPPFMFGAGAVELLGKEMTKDLQALKQEALEEALETEESVSIELVTKGVSFGRLVVSADGTFDISEVEGIDSDPDSETFLVVQPFDRKGDTKTIRTFDINAVQFHLGMEPVEVVGEGFDGDGDSVADELLTGEISALSIFIATTETPRQRPHLPKGRAKSHKIKKGSVLFSDIGCAECHIPSLETNSRILTLSFPEVPYDPDANVFYEIDLTEKPMRFRTNHQGGVTVPLYGDLKRHRMGTELAEASGFGDSFTTARLWGVADTAPYLHDGRAFTILEAIRIHGGSGSEAESAVDNFLKLSDDDQNAVLAFLRTLRTPFRTGRDLDRLARKKPE